MKIELTEQQYRYLLDLVYIGNWVINSTRENDRIREYDQVESLIFSHCLQHKMSKLVELKERENKENLKELQGDYSQITWGSQIRSYVFQPYTMVKDHRTNAEVGNVQAVMDGDLDVFINEELKQKV